MKRTRPFLLGFLLAIVATICVAQTIRGPVTSTPFSRSLLDDTSAAAARSTLGITGSTNYVFDTGQFTITDTSDVHLKDGLTVSNMIVKTAMTNDSLTASMAVVSDANKKIVSSAASLTELAHLVGVTSQVVDTNDFESTQFDIRAGFAGVKDSASFTNLALKLITTFGSGSATAPSLAFQSDQNTGFFTESPDSIGFAAGGAGLGNWTVNGLWPYTDSSIELGSSGRYWSSIYGDVHLAQGGFAAAPGFSWGPDLDTGFFRDTANVIKLSTGGVQKWEWDASGHYVPFVDLTYDIGTSLKAVRDVYAGQLQVDAGSISAPSIQFAGDNVGFYHIANDSVGLALNALKHVNWEEAGGTAKQYIYGAVSGGNAQLALVEQDQSANEEKWIMAVSGGNFTLGAFADDELSLNNAFYITRGTGADVDAIIMPLNASGEGVIVGANDDDNPDARFHVKSTTNGDVIQRLEGESGGGLGDIVEDTYMARAETTDATVTTLHTVPITASRTYFIEATVTARRTGGAAGTADDGAVYILRAMVTTKAGTVTIDSVVATLVAEDVAAYACTLDVSTTNIRVRVTGVASTTIDWACKVTAQAQGL